MESVGNGIGWQWNRLAMESVGNGIGWQGERLAKDQLVDEIHGVDDAWYGHSTTSCSAHRAVGLRIHGNILRIAMVQ